MDLDDAISVVLTLQHRPMTSISKEQIRILALAWKTVARNAEAVIKAHQATYPSSIEP